VEVLVPQTQVVEVVEVIILALQTALAVTAVQVS
jgi:hypothetical protein